MVWYLVKQRDKSNFTFPLFTTVAELQGFLEATPTPKYAGPEKLKAHLHFLFRKF
jgi:hypothetical protein